MNGTPQAVSRIGSERGDECHSKQQIVDESIGT
jgi:hypothetical protein